KSGKVETIRVHHLGPGRDEILDELLLRVTARIDFRKCTELGVRTEDQVGTGARPLDLLGLAVARLVHLIGTRGRIPYGAHAEQVDEEVVSQRARLIGEDA